MSALPPLANPLPVPRSRKLSVREQIVVHAMAEGLDIGPALRRAGWGEWVQHHGGTWLDDHPHVGEVLDRMREEILCDAEEVLRELMSNYAGLLIQEARLQSMLGQDIAELYDDHGVFKAVKDWPVQWRTQLVVEIESRESSERSHDGATVDKDGGWDKTGELKKVKRESTLAIEKELRDCKRAQIDCLKVIGNHVNIKAFPVPGDKLADAVGNLSDSINSALQGVRRRERKLLPE